ncbi:MAG: tRNA (N6-threonylcarbamoyladenosine(37)-N6)-methyltransferase TrmO [Promethearchaeota archaeon]
MDFSERNLHDVNKRDPLKTITFTPIGIFHSPLKNLKDVPIQFSMSEITGKIEICQEYSPGLKDLNGFSHIYCIYLFDLIKLPVPMQSKPFLDNEKKGVFSMRTPFRPNPIGLSILEINKIIDNFIFVKNVDILDQTPILDLKPYVSEFDYIPSSRSGWLNGKIRK